MPYTRDYPLYDRAHTYLERLPRPASEGHAKSMRAQSSAKPACPTHHLGTLLYTAQYFRDYYTFMYRARRTAVPSLCAGMQEEGRDANRIRLAPCIMRASSMKLAHNRSGTGSEDFSSTVLRRPRAPRASSMQRHYSDAMRPIVVIVNT
jgi:hypothetical protein